MYAEAQERREVDVDAQQKAIEEINELLTGAEASYEAALAAAAKIADKHDIRIRVANASGGTATYVPKQPKNWESSSCSFYESGEPGEWNSSSMYC